MLAYFLTKESYEMASSRFADIVVSCGSSTLPVHQLVRAENDASDVVVMTPPLPYRLFRHSLVIAPFHDHARCGSSRCVRVKTAFTFTDKATCTEQGEKLRRRIGAADAGVVSLLIGGDAARYVFDVHMCERAIDACIRFARERNMVILATTSRRTRPDVIARVKAKLAHEPLCRLLVIPTEENIPHVVCGMLAISDVVVVTEESVSMISESVQAAKPSVCVVRMSPRGLKKKHLRFQQALAADGVLRVCDADAVYECLGSFTQAASGQRPNPCCDEYEHVMNALRSIV
jgi:mitochondrial fission protein ELM1